jgi:hypothetical protein
MFERLASSAWPDCRAAPAWFTADRKRIVDA